VGNYLDVTPVRIIHEMSSNLRTGRKIKKITSGNSSAKLSVHDITTVLFRKQTITGVRRTTTTGKRKLLNRNRKTLSVIRRKESLSNRHNLINNALTNLKSVTVLILKSASADLLLSKSKVLPLEKVHKLRSVGVRNGGHSYIYSNDYSRLVCVGEKFT